jgi:hypothetical protein
MSIREESGAAHFESFRQFYPFYLSEHRNRTSRRLHVAGTLLAVLAAVLAVAGRRWTLLVAVPLAGYGLAWIGHFFFEHNAPATFRHPFFSLRGDLRMAREVLLGRIHW